MNKADHMLPTKTLHHEHVYIIIHLNKLIIVALQTGMLFIGCYGNITNSNLVSCPNHISEDNVWLAL